MAEEISQEELTSVRQFIHVFRSAEKMERVLTVIVTQQEQIGLLEGRYRAAEKRATDAEARAGAKELDADQKYQAAEDRLGQQRRDHQEEIRRLDMEASDAESRIQSRLASKQQEVSAQLSAAQQEHGAKLAGMRQIEAEARDRIDVLEQGERALRADIKTLETRKAELQAEFSALLSK